MSGLSPDLLHPECREVYDAFKKGGFNPEIQNCVFPNGEEAATILPPNGYPASARGDLLLPVSWVWARMEFIERVELLEIMGIKDHAKISKAALKKWSEIRPEGKAAIYKQLCDAVVNAELDGDL